jgi:hypothetical protein
VLVGRVILGHVTATLVDLAQRGFLSLDETHDGLDEAYDGADEDWLLIDRRRDPDCAGDALLDFERTLLDGLFYGNSLVRLSGLGETFLLPMNQMRKQLRRDAVRNGRLRRWRRGKRTHGGEQLLHRIHDFRREVRTLAAAGDETTMAGLAPYAMIFGITSTTGLRSADGTGSCGHGRERGWAQAARLGKRFAEACANTEPFQAWVGNDDFAHAWSAPHDHQHGHDHGQSHGDSYGGHMGGGHMGGGHMGGGHMGAGGHGGH